MSRRQWKRLEAVERLSRGELTTTQAAQVLGLGERQVRRVRRAVEKQGAQGLVHGNTGRSPKHRVAKKVRERIVKLRQGKYAGFNDQHFSEKLCEVEQIPISRPSVRRLLRAAGIGSPRKRRARRHRQRRERKAQAGLMILWDGSRHEWLEERGPMLCLMGAVDDATGELLAGAHFVEQECAAGYLWPCSRPSPRARGCPGVRTWISTAASSATTSTGRWRRSCAGSRSPRRWDAP